MKINPAKSIVAIDDELLKTSDPWKRSILTVYRTHTFLEISGRLDDLMETVARQPAYEFHGPWVGPVGLRLTGFEAVQHYYKRNIDHGVMIGQFEVARLAVTDWGIATDGLATIQTPGALLLSREDGANFDPEFHYAVTSNIAVFVLCDRDSGLISGEIVYTSPTLSAEKIDPADVLSYAQAEQLLGESSVAELMTGASR